MTTAEAFAPAKVNLTLHVTGRMADGYHLLDSLVVFADIGDLVQVRPGRGLSLTVGGPMASGVPTDDSNLVIRAARLAGVRDAAFTLQKHLPAAAGIGGGSSDAAACLRALCQSHGVALPDDPVSLGADLPVCLLARPVRMRGIGERLGPVDGLPSLPAVLVNPGVAVPTPDVFRALRNRDGAGMTELPRSADRARWIDWLRLQRNDLEEPAIAVAPVVAEVLRDLEASGALLSRMSGSGATCFGLFPDHASACAAAASLARPGWWVRPTTLGA